MSKWNPTAEELIGMKAEDLKSKLDAAATKDDLTNALKPVEELKGSLDAIKASLAALTTPKEPVIETPPDDTDPAVKMLANPKGFVSDETKDLRESQLETRA